MLASVYSYRVMVKSVSSCCVHGRRVLSNPVTYRALYIDAMHASYVATYHAQYARIHTYAYDYTLVANKLQLASHSA